MQTLPLFQSPSPWHQAVLVGLAVVVAGALGLICKYTLRRGSFIAPRSDLSSSRNFKYWAGAFVLWQLTMGVLAGAGYFRAFDQPWRALPTVGCSMIAAIYLAMRTQTLDWLSSSPSWAWLALQSFRLPLELLLYDMFQHEIIGQHMTFAGFNADILVGLSAPLAAWIVWRQNGKVWTHKFSLMWNVFGLLLLLNILILAVLSVPFPFQYFRQEPANRMVADFPFVWLPTLFIPLALFAHLVSLRLAWRRLKASPTMSL
jgi:hypothetical protein